MRAVGEAGTERSAEISELWEEMFLMLFRVSQDVRDGLGSFLGLACL